MKTTHCVLSLWVKRIGYVITMAALTSMVACERETPDAQSIRPDASASERASAKQSGEVVRKTAPASRTADLQKLVGRWVRTDSPYVIEIRTVKHDGTLEAAYYNPQPINVARAEARDKDDGLEVFVELRDVNYPGSTYTLVYDRAKDLLRGTYFLAVSQQSFGVTFSRERPRR